YHVIALRTSPTSTQLIVNGVLEAFRDVDPSPLASQPVGGLTIGIGARVVTSLTSLAGGQPEASTKPCDMVSTDSRTAFFGRVESFRVLVGGPPLVVGELGTADFVTQYREFLREHYAIPFEHSWILFQSFASLESGETVPGIGLGHVVASALVRDPYGENASVVRSVTPGSYQIFWPPELTTWPLSSRRFVAVSILRAIAAYDFDAPVDDIGYDDVHDTQVEFRGVPVDADFFKHVHVQRGYVADKLGLLGSIQLRSFEPDLLTESDDKYGDGLWQRRHTPYLLRGPRALQPQWHHGIVPAALGQNPIALLAPWRIEATGEEVLLAACRRTLYWVKPRQKADNPYTDALALWMGGNRGDYCRARGMTAHGFDLDWTEHEAVVDLWIKPDRLDGNRVLVCSGNPLLSDLRYLILLNDGRLEVWGKLADGSHWRWVQGTAQTVPLVQQTAGVAVKLHVWNHVAVRLGDGAV